MKKQKNKITIMLYGASTKGNTLLQYYGITPKLIKYAVKEASTNGVNTPLALV